MKTKLLSLLVALSATTALWASNVITYTATKKLTSMTLEVGATTFGSAITSHTYNAGTGTITCESEVTTIGYYAFDGCSGLASVTIPNSVTTIEDGAFEDCYGLTSVTIGNSVTFIGEDAFSSCNRLTSIICFAAYPPSFYGEPFWETFVTVYVPASFLSAHQNGWGFQVLPLGADVKPIDGENPIVTPTDQDVTITWAITDGADTYTLTITAGGEVFCVMTFNTEGQMINIAFKAPAADGAHQAPAATLTAQGYQFTVTGLNPGTAYNYSVTATDADGQTLAEHKGNFSTTGGTGLESVHDARCTMHKVLRNGQLLIETNNATYTPMGQKVR